VLYLYTRAAKYIFDVLQVRLYVQFVQGKSPIKSQYLPIIYTLYIRNIGKLKTCQGNNFTFSSALGVVSKIRSS